jgi:hypothetical protein
MKTWGSEGIAPPFLTSALDGGERSVSRPVRVSPRERASGTHWIGGWVGPRTGRDAMEQRTIFAPAGNRTLVIKSIALRYTNSAILAPNI